MVREKPIIIAKEREEMRSSNSTVNLSGGVLEGLEEQVCYNTVSVLSIIKVLIMKSYLSL